MSGWATGGALATLINYEGYGNKIYSLYFSKSLLFAFLNIFGFGPLLTDENLVAPS